MRTHNIPFSIKKITLNYSKFADMVFPQGTQKRVRNNRGKRAISVRTTEGLLYMVFTFCSNYMLILRLSGTYKHKFFKLSTIYYSVIGNFGHRDM